MVQTRRFVRASHTPRPGLVRAALALLLSVVLGFLWLPVVASPASAAPATPAFKQVRANEITSGKLNSLAFKSPNTAGNLIVVYLTWTNTEPVSVTDTRGNDYTSAGSQTTWGANRSSQVFYAKNINGGPNTVQATFLTAMSSWANVYPRVFRHR